jgi:DNA repair exonuclease SbcCD ATPase subunit
MPDHFKLWRSSISTRPSFGADANLNARDESLNAIDGIDFPARLDGELEALGAAVDAYAADKDETGRSKTAQAITDARQEITRIQGELFEAEQRLEALVKAGSALQKYAGQVSNVEGQLQRILELYTKQVQSELVEHLFGHKVDLSKLSKDRLNELKLHKRIQDLQKFVHVSQFESNVSPAHIEKKVNVVGNKLVELKAHIAADQAAQAKS